LEINDDASCIIDHQQQLLNCTFRHAANVNFPVRSQYQISLLKHIIKTLEVQNCEIYSGFYEVLCNLLSQPATNDSFLHFFTKTDSLVPLVSVNENVAVISQGTTGLSTWPAARVLAELCLNNSGRFDGKNILELGCGTGLLGLSVLRSCHPKSYTFSDCHEEVLKLVQKNIEVNYLDNDIRVKVVD